MSALSLRAVATAALALAALLAAGVLTLGPGGGEPAAAQPAKRGCVTATFTYDAAEARRQARFEAELAEGASLPTPGFHAAATDRTATVHAASHSYVVVYYRPGSDTAGLRNLAAAATEQQIPLVAAPREQKPALVAITRDRELRCSGAEVDEVRGFAAASYPGLAQ